MTFLLRIKNQDSIMGMQILSLFIMHHLSFYFYAPQWKDVCSTNMQKEVDRQKSLLSWHFTIFTIFHYLEWNFGREPLLLSLNFHTCIYSCRGRFCCNWVLKDAFIWMESLWILSWTVVGLNEGRYVGPSLQHSVKCNSA